MAKRELSSTLRNLKFMQRATLKDERGKKEEEKPAPSISQNRKCIVIMEGNPHPGALRGRMSFQSFNPFIEKLNEDAEKYCQTQQPNASSTEASRMADRESGILESQLSPYGPGADNESIEYKRKKLKTEVDTSNQAQSTRAAEQSEQSNSRAGTSKQQKQHRLDWRVLRPPVGQTKQRS